MANTIEEILDSNEKIFWRGKPKYSAYILQYAPLSLFGLIWFSILSIFYWGIASGEMPLFALLIIIPHTLIGIGMLGAPLWASLVFPYIEYSITSKRIIIKSGFFARSFKTVDYVNLTDVSVDIGLVGNLTNTGTINFVSGMGIFTEKTGKSALAGIEKPYEVFKLLKQVYFDIKSDVEFPNKLRPPVNPGYQSEYQPPKI